ncbi:hypothetical protein [Marinobacter sp. SS21]|uniref:hypothetical protein n=1 Tax=Marinobacter sp. SS21 TaxID=2979460 RepID=UPI00232BBE01|nr:hypothetical protein [Marinobacter sp. SS21]MDC0662536.1 hypothetical protein [Marinobacter sp. SS21]
MTIKKSMGYGLMLAAAVMLAGQVAAAPGGKNAEDHPGQGHRDAAAQQRYQMEEHAESQRERMADEAERRRDEAEDMRERAEHEAERGREQAEAGMDEARGRAENAGGPQVNPGERGSEQGQAAKREHSKAWWNFWD